MEIEEHRRPNESRLEQYREDIEAMRERSWPYRRIASWLKTDWEVIISAEAIRKFCLVRGIKKGAPKAILKPPRRSPTGAKALNQTSEKKLFHYEGEGPIRTRKDQR